MKDLRDRALQAAAVMVLFALALRWAWSVVRPLVPFLAVAFATWSVARYARSRRDRW